MNLQSSGTRWLVLMLALAALAPTAAQARTRRDTSDVVSRYLRSHATPASSRDVFERYAAAHPYRVGIATASVPVSGGFRWADYGAGVGTGVVLVLLLAGGVFATPVRRRQRAQPAIGR